MRLTRSELTFLVGPLQNKSDNLTLPTVSNI
nr:MAG TPA: hypothetical protein [Caudoviricetes sp.]